MKKGSIGIIAGLLLIAAALFLTSYNLWDNHRAGREAKKVLEKVLSVIEDDPIPREGRLRPGGMEYPDYVLNPQMNMPVKNIDGKAFVGVIAIPTIGKELPVFDECDYENLNNAPCRFRGTAYQDNMILCAHNFEDHFGLLKNLRYNDPVIFTDMDGNIFNYQVVEIENLSSNALKEMLEGEWDLTLFTCTLSGMTRVTVRCKKV